MAVIYDMSHIDAMEGHEFEQFIANLLRKLGYQNVEVTPGSGDQGVDVLAEKEDVRYAIQCKCYSSDLGNTPVQEVNTGKVIYHCHVGVVVTNRYFTQGAQEAATATGILLWDRDKLQDLITQAELVSDESSGTSPLAKKNTAIGTKRLTKWQKRNEEYKQVILSSLSEDYFGYWLTETEIREKILQPAYPKAVFCNQTVATLLNSMVDKYDKESGELISEGAIIREYDTTTHKSIYMMIDAEAVEDRKRKEAEVEARQIQEQERIERYKQSILAYMFRNPELATTITKILKVLMSAYPGELWSHYRTATLLRAYPQISK